MPAQFRGEEVSKLFLDYYTLLHEKSFDFFEEVISASSRDTASLAAREHARRDLIEITAANEYIALANNAENLHSNEGDRRAVTALDATPPG